ncbi:putative membrane protein [Caulobacter ginsengisoli]|uniref:Membrane protein n=1 Tax=Caulobacter ginsengisoli TaxID=400775 RepID=A0ABU0ING9_9CAUL|nr:periplasmic heavy metal sensor [Caulobacter ginsengisoli]MDQ0463535.1 putative membrane protein [Caulobacter ginsengisoli]
MKPRWLYVALIVSVALNLFLGGLIVGAVVVGRRVAEAQPVGAGVLKSPIWRAGDGLAQPYRREFRKTVREAVLATRDDIREGRRLRQDALAQMGQPTYDIAAVEAQLQRGRALDQKARGQVEAAILRFAATLPPDQRAILSEGMRKPTRPVRPADANAPELAPPSAPPRP